MTEEPNSSPPDPPVADSWTAPPPVPPAASFPAPGIPTKYCFACGAILDARAEICPICGVRQQPPPAQSIDSALGRSRIVAALLGIFLGGLGVHKFYLGKIAQRIIYLIFFWTLIPALVGFIEGIWYLTMSDGDFQQRYPR